MTGMNKNLAGPIGAVAGAGITLLARWGLGMPLFGFAPVIVSAFCLGLFCYFGAAVGFRRFIGIDAVRGMLVGLAGTGVAIGITIAIRTYAMHLSPWKADPVLTIGIFTGIICYLAGLGVLTHWARWWAGAEDKPKPHKTGWIRYFSVDTNHKVIGIQYFVTGMMFLPFGVMLQIIGRAQMADPNVGILSKMAYESVISTHGIMMLFIVALPVFSGLMNYFVPIQIGARDMAFPRLNALTFWLTPASGLLIAFSLMAGGFDTGWTAYPPLSVLYENPGMTLVLIGVFVAGLGSVLTAVNVITTIWRMRAPGMKFFRMPIFIWSAIATVGLTLGFTQFIGMSFMMLLLERTLGMGFFQPAMGGQVLLYQYLFWFYSHPAVYVFVLLGLGMISDIIPVFVHQPLFGYKTVAVSSPAIAIGGTVVFIHHMFAAGIPGFLKVPFMVTTLLVAVPTGVKVFAWVATTWLGKIEIKTPLLFIFTAIIIFLIGGLAGVPLGIVPVDLYLHATYWVVGHFHAMFFGGFLLPTMAGLYFWFPKVTGKMLREGLGKVQWALMSVGMFLIFIPMLGLGLEGMRRRVATYTVTPLFQTLHILIGVGGVLVFAGIVVMIYNIVWSLKHGEESGDNPWGARTLEWLIPSPPPEENFVTVPEILDRPHMHGVEGSVHARFGSGESEAGRGS